MNQNLEQDYNLISNKLPIGILIFAVIIIFGVIFTKKPEIDYNISTEKMLENLQTQKQIIGLEEFINIIYENDSLYQFIDLRSTHDYLIGHIKNAINIPIHKILDKEYKNILNQDKKINVLYYSDHCGACGPWIILTQIGYKNNKILLGGYDYVKPNIINNFSPLTGNFRNETARYDFAKIVKETSGAGSTTSENNATKPTLVKKKKKKGGAEGGC
ncbi:MAG: rhodanese-like domain-containing protein [Bacteroidales bacterium]|nr:rhodanese-like domain-containing protein [Bacteroidales bacterium]